MLKFQHLKNMHGKKKTFKSLQNFYYFLIDCAKAILFNKVQNRKSAYECIVLVSRQGGMMNMLRI